MPIEVDARPPYRLNPFSECVDPRLMTRYPIFVCFRKNMIDASQDV